MLVSRNGRVDVNLRRINTYYRLVRIPGRNLTIIEPAMRLSVYVEISS